jgi:hypothetical protein
MVASLAQAVDKSQYLSGVDQWRLVKTNGLGGVIITARNMREWSVARNTMVVFPRKRLSSQAFPKIDSVRIFPSNLYLLQGKPWRPSDSSLRKKFLANRQGSPRECPA